MHSMTGFGRTELKSKFGKIIVEIASVNNRFLEYSIRLPRPYLSLEPNVRELLASKINRGKITVTISIDLSESTDAGIYINEAAVKSYLKQIKNIEKKYKIPGSIEIKDLIVLPEVVRQGANEPMLETLWKQFEKGLKSAVGRLVSMREREGKAMAVDMKKRLSNLSKCNNEVKKKTKNSVELYSKKLTARIMELTDSTRLDRNRLEEEVAYFSDRTDISEEIVRLQTHIEEYLQTLSKKDAVGRRLNFILQEMNREVNTIGSKASDFEISSTVITMKEEIEKLREMIQNVE